MKSFDSNLTMQAVRIHEYGGPETMRLEQLPMPEPGPGQALVRIRAASVNFLDIQQRRGDLVRQAFYKKEAGLATSLPVTLGSQGVGVVEALGPGESHARVGDRVVCAMGSGTYATHAVVPAARLIPIPDRLDFERAAAGLTQGFLAYAFTHHAYAVQPGDWCLVQAAAGGLGSLICQMIRIRGGKTIGVVSSEQKAEFARRHGADAVIVSAGADIAEEARRLTEGRGVRVVYDGVGKDTFEANLDSLAPAGYLIMYGQSSGYVPPFDLMKLQEKGSLFVTRTNGLPYTKEWPAFAASLMTWLDDGRLTIPIDRVYPLAEAARAHEAMERRQTTGRTLLLP